MSLQPDVEKQAHDEVSNRRIETLVDGVFSIVLTLLIFDIKAPQAASDTELNVQLLALGPKLFAYVLSFVILALFWFGHQLVSRHIRRSDHIHLWLNLLYIMCIAFIPFSAALLGVNGQHRSTAVIYGVNLLAAGVVRCLHWQYATQHHRLVSLNLDSYLIQAVKRAFLVVPIAYSFAIAISFLSVPVSLLIYTISPILGVIQMNTAFRTSHRRSVQPPAWFDRHKHK